MINGSIRKLCVGTLDVELPTVWLGHDFKHPHAVWQTLPRCSGIMVNAYQILNRNTLHRRVCELGIHGVLDFSGPVFMDSGGFQMMRAGFGGVDRASVAKLYLEARPDVAAMLDFPPSPDSPVRERSRRWSKTLRTAQWMRANCEEAKLAPVLHGFNARQLERRCLQLREMYADPAIVCLGGLVPFLKGISNSSSRGNDASARKRWGALADGLKVVRAIFPNAALHAFGAGSLTSIYLLAALGVDSFDSSAWRLKAAYGAIQLRGFGDRFPSPLRRSAKSRPALCKSALARLEECECVGCAAAPVHVRRRQLALSFRNRASHNASVVLDEVTALRSAIYNGAKLSHLDERLSAFPRYHQFFRHIFG